MGQRFRRSALGPLLSATNAENGTVTYTYNSDTTLATKTDAKNQQTQYRYDNYKRVYQVRHYRVSDGGEETSPQVNYYYDSNPDDGGTFSQYVAGRLAVVKYGAVNIAGLNIVRKFAEWYSYNQPGGMTPKRLQLSETIPGSIPHTTTLNFDSRYSCDGEGENTLVSYPSTFTVSGLRQQVPTAGPTYTYLFDTMSRPVGLTDQNSATLVSGVSYRWANELPGIAYLRNIETRTYNNRLQLTNITAPGLNVTYNYTAGANNGKIASANDNGELIQYTYDSLNRLYTRPRLPQACNATIMMVSASDQGPHYTRVEWPE